MISIRTPLLVLHLDPSTSVPVLLFCPGMKSRGVYETPGGTVLLTARRAMESITLDRGEAHLKVGHCSRQQ